MCFNGKNLAVFPPPLASGFFIPLLAFGHLKYDSANPRVSLGTADYLSPPPRQVHCICPPNVELLWQLGSPTPYYHMIHN